MPMINQFPSPRAALLWQYVRCFEWFFLIGAPASVAVGYLVASDEDRVAALLAPLLVMPLLVAEMLKSERCAPAFHRRLPINIRSGTQAELAAVLVLVAWLLLGLLIGGQIRDFASAPPPPWIFPATVAGGVLGLILIRGNEAKLGGGFAIGLGALALVIVFIASIVLGPFSSPIGHVASEYFLSGLALVSVVGSAYTALIYCARVTRCEGRSEPTGGVRYVELIGTPQVKASTSFTHHSTVQPKPFASRDAAQRWHDWKYFCRIEIRTTFFWTCCMMQLVYTGFALEAVGGSDTPFADFFCGVGVALATSRFNWSWECAPPSLPQSDWSRSRSFLQLGVVTLITLCTLLWAWQIVNVIAINDTTTAAALAPEPYLAALWVAWVSLAIGPGFLLGVLLLFWWQYFSAQHLGGTGTLVCGCLAWLCLPIFFRRSGTFRESMSRALGPLLAAAALLAGHTLMARFPLSPLVHWTLREALGCGMVVALLRYHLHLRTLHTATAIRMCFYLLASAGSVWVSIAIWGPPEEPEHGVMAVFLALGYVPPLFLPALMTPHYFAWLRANADSARESRRKMPWMM